MGEASTLKDASLCRIEVALESGIAYHSRQRVPNLRSCEARRQSNLVNSWKKCRILIGSSMASESTNELRFVTVGRP